MTATMQRPAEPIAPQPGAQRTGISETARDDVHRTLLALLASALGALPLCQLLIDRTWLIDVWLSMLVVIAPAALLRYWRPPSAAQTWIGVILLVPWLTMRYVSEHAVGGVLPLRGTWHDVGALMTSLHHTTSEQAAPINSTVAVRLALCALLALVAALIDLIAVVGRRGALAGIPLLVVFTVSGAVPREVVSWWLFALSGVAFLILLALDSSDDLYRWGHYVPRAGQGRSRPSRAAGVSSGQRIAIAAIVLAITLPVLVPSDSRNLVANLFHNSSGSGSGGGFGAGGGSSIDPFVALRGQLNRKVTLPLMDVQITSQGREPVGSKAAVQPFYLRTNVLSQFIGTGWKPAATGAGESVDTTRFQSAPGTPYPPRSVSFSADIKVTGLSSNPPVFSVPTRVEGLNSDAQWSPQDGLLVGDRVSKGSEYRLTVTQPVPTVSDLQNASAKDPQMDQWLSLPAIPTYVHQLVTRLTGTKATPYAKARAISDYFADPQNGFTYSLSTQDGDSGNELVDFLKNRIGYCQQYAAAMGVMLRMAGVPARVVLGYTHSAPNAAGRFTVTTDDAHAWVEAYFSGQGWVPFDPTPLAGIAGGATNDLSWAPHGKGSAGTNVVPTERAPSSSVAIQPSTTASGQRAARAAASSGSPAILPLISIGVVALLAVLVLTPWGVRQRRRRRRLHKAGDGDTDALWAELSDTAVDLGFVWSPARTPRQVAQWLSAPAGSASGSLHTLASAVERARYAPPAEQGADGRQLLGEFTKVQAGLSAARTPRERLRSRFWPASLGWSSAHLPGGRLARRLMWRRRH